MKKPAIPSPTGIPQDVARVLRPVKAVLDALTGTTGGEIEQLPSAATTAEIVTKINQIVSRLNGSGE